jgi:hypothetical protein
VHNIINWSEIEQTLSNLYSSKTGASAYPPIMMFKILILQAWYVVVLDGCYFIRLVVFWLSYAKVSQQFKFSYFEQVKLNKKIGVKKMSKKRTKHKSLSELDDVHNIINWSEIEQTLSNLYSSKTGASAYPPIMMFKILTLQAWYGLSDEALEKKIARDLMFRRFIDLSLSEAVPSLPLRLRDCLASMTVASIMLIKPRETIILTFV